MGRAWWLLGCAAATFVAAEIAVHLSDRGDRQSIGWGVFGIVAMIAAAVLAVAAVAALP